MKGLLLKNFYMLMGYCRSFLVLILVFLVIGQADPGNAFITFYPCIMGGVLVTSLISYDEREHWDQYAATMPYSRALIVSSYYLTALIILTGTVSLSFGVNCLRYAVMGGEVEPLMDLLPNLLIMSLLPAAAMIPPSIRFGTEKGRTAYLMAIGGFCAILAFIGISDSAALLRGISLWLVVLGAAVAFAVSWCLSIRFYQKREL